MGGGKDASAAGKGAPPTKGGAKGSRDVEYEDDDECSDEDSSEEQVEMGSEDGDADMGDDGESALSLFGPERFPGSAAFWAHAEAEHGFSLMKLRALFGDGSWTDYHRIRLVNYLRKVGPDKAKAAAASLDKDSPIWTDDTLLQPVLDNDLLLFEDDEDEDWNDLPQDVAANLPSLSKDEEIEQLRAELASARRMLSVVAAEGDLFGAAPASSSSGPLQSRPAASATQEASSVVFDASRSRSLVLDVQGGKLAGYLAGASGLRNKVVLDAFCGSGIVSCLCANAGASLVFAVDSDPRACEAAANVIKINGVKQQVELMEADPVQPRLPVPPEGKGHGICDVLLSERILSDLRYGPTLVDFFHVRRHHLRPGGSILPTHLRLLVSAVNTGNHLSQNKFASLNLSSFGLQLPRVDNLAQVHQSQVTSKEPASILDVDLLTAKPEELLPKQQKVSLELQPGSCTNAVALYIDAYLNGLNDLENRLSMAPSKDGSQVSPLARQVLLHFANPDGKSSGPLHLACEEYSRLDLTFSASAAEGTGNIRLDVQASAVSSTSNEPLPLTARFEASFQLER